MAHHHEPYIKSSWLVPGCARKMPTACGGTAGSLLWGVFLGLSGCTWGSSWRGRDCVTALLCQLLTAFLAVWPGSRRDAYSGRCLLAVSVVHTCARSSRAQIFFLILFSLLLTLFLGHNPALSRCFLEGLFLKPALRT